MAKTAASPGTDAPQAKVKVMRRTGRGGTGRGGLHDAAIVEIDPRLQLDDDDLPPAQTRPKSPWTLQLELLVDMVDDGRVEPGKFVRIGEFKSEQGAQQRASRMHEMEPKLREWAFEYRWKTVPSPLAVGKKWSVLYARLVPTSQAGE